MKRRVLAMFLVLCLIFSMAPVPAFAAEVTASGTCGDNLTWVLDTEGTLTISGTGTMQDFEYVPNVPTAPWASYTEDILRVHILEGVTSVGNYAYKLCSNLTEVALPSSIRSIGYDAFWKCSSLTSIHLPEGLTSIEECAFMDCSSLTGIVIPDSVTYINASIFSGCTGLTEVVIPESIPQISNFLFNGCSGLRQVIIPGGISYFGAYAFAGCSSLTDVTISDGVTTIGSSAFEKCTSLTSIVIPESVTSIYERAFADCSALEEIWFMGDAPGFWYGDYFANITATAYYPAGNDTWTEDVMQQYGGNITWKPYSTATEVASGTCGENLTWVLDTEGTLTISGTGEMNEYGSGSYPWYDYSDSIKAVVIQAGVTSVGTSAFYSCTNLETVSLPDGLKSIGDFAFEECDKLTEVTIPDGVESIGGYAFYSCAGLVSVTIPESVSDIGSFAFSFCSSLENVQIPQGITNLNWRVFGSCSSLTSIVIPDSVTYIDEAAFVGCSGLTEIVIPENVEYIGDVAFGMCTSLTEIYFRGDAPSFYNTAFENVTATAYYPAGNDTWTAEVMQDYGGNITWICSALDYENGFCTSCDTCESAVLNGDVWEISNAGQLYWFAAQVSNGNTAMNGKLMADIVINENVLTADGKLNSSGSFRDWTPISGAYTGTFDGNGHVISGMVSRIYGTNAMFQQIGADGTVKNLGLVDSYFRSMDWHVGSIAVGNAGSILNCFNAGTVSTAEFNAGGIVAGNSGRIENCYNLGLVSGSGMMTGATGGIAGGNSSGVIQNCYNIGSVKGSHEVGAIVGCAGGTITNCYYLTGCAVNYSGLVQFGVGIYETDSTVADVTGCTTGMTAEQFASGEVAYLLGEAFGQTIGIDPYPILGGQKVFQIQSGGNTTWINHTQHTYENGFCIVCDSYEPAVLNGDFYEISNAGQLYWFAEQVNGGEYDVDGKLMADIVINENVLAEDGSLKPGTYREWVAIGDPYANEACTGRYSGIFEGNDKTISGIYLESGMYTGLFGRVEEGTVRNLNVSDSYIVGEWFVGAIAGAIDTGFILNCSNSSTVISTGPATGGIVGTAWDSIVNNCINSGLVSGSGEAIGGIVGGNSNSAVSDCCNTGAVSGYTFVGGIVGENCGKLHTCYNTGDISGTAYVGGIAGFQSFSYSGEETNIGELKNCHSYCSVEGEAYTGGIVGYIQNSVTVQNCYALQSPAVGEIITDYGDPVLENVVIKTAEQFASGEVAYLLGNPFGQTIGTDPYPVFGEPKVYRNQTGSADAGVQYVYANSQADHVTSHIYTSVVTAPTCTGIGYTTYTCSCGDSFMTDEVSATGHSGAMHFLTDFWTDDGFACPVFVCTNTNCNEDCMVHTLSDAGTITKSPTCTETGIREYFMDFSEIVPPEGWSWDDFIMNSNSFEDQNGKTGTTCTWDNESKVLTAVKILPTLDCIFTRYESNHDATCVSNGTVTAHCDRGCGASNTVEDLESLNPDAHAFGEWITEGNQESRNCTLCSFTESKIITDGGDVEIDAPGQPDLDFDVDHVEPSDDRYVLVEESLRNQETEREVLKVFDITLKNADGVHVQPDGSVKVKLPLDWEKNGNYKVYRVNEDGTLTDMDAYRQGSHMVFETDHFSLYIIVEEAGITGDLDGNGEIDSDDLTLLARHVGGIELVTGIALANADVNGDGLVNSDDLTKHARFVGGIITSWDQE